MNAVSELLYATKDAQIPLAHIAAAVLLVSTWQVTGEPAKVLTEFLKNEPTIYIPISKTQTLHQYTVVLIARLGLRHPRRG